MTTFNSLFDSSNGELDTDYSLCLFGVIQIRHLYFVLVENKACCTKFAFSRVSHVEFVIFKNFCWNSHHKIS